MHQIYIFDKIADLKSKFQHFMLHKKKITALENYSEVAPVKHKDYLILIKKCMDGGFLGEKEGDFLCHLSDKYFTNCNFLDWSHKTKWLKTQIERMRPRMQPRHEARQFVQHDLFDFDRVRTAKMPSAPSFVPAVKRSPFFKRVGA